MKKEPSTLAILLDGFGRLLDEMYPTVAAWVILISIMYVLVQILG